jgi:hypothetical protein
MRTSLPEWKCERERASASEAVCLAEEDKDGTKYKEYRHKSDVPAKVSINFVIFAP